MANNKLSALRHVFLNALNICIIGALLLLPRPTAGCQQSSAPPQEQKKRESEEREKTKPTPIPGSKTPVKQPEGKTLEKSQPSQPQQSDPTRPQEGGDDRPPARDKQAGEKGIHSRDVAAPTPTQAEKVKEPSILSPTEAQTTPTTQPTPRAQQLPAIEETPSQNRTKEEPAEEVTPQTAQGQTVSPPRVHSTPATDLDRTQWNFRREIEALAQPFSLGKILLSVLFLLLGYFANKIVAMLAAMAGRRRNVYAEWLRRLTPFASFGIWFAVVLVIVEIFTQSLLALVLLITVAALALAFASQPLLRDVVGGLVILFERPFRLGDRITVGNHQGEVKKIGLRAFQLASSNGALIAIPNAEVMGQPIVNASPGMVGSQVTIDLPLPQGIDPEPAKRIAFEAAVVSPYLCIHKPIEVYVDEQRQNDLSGRIIIQSFVFDAQYERQLISDTVERARRGFQNLRRGSSEAQNCPD